MKDGEKCISLKPDFVKGYSRKGAALSFLKRYDEAINVYEEGLKIDPSNQQLLTDLENARKDAAGPSAGGMGFFSDPQFLAQMMTNPRARELLKDPETAMLMKMMQQQPNNPGYDEPSPPNRTGGSTFGCSRLLSNPKVMKLLGVVLGFEVGDENDLSAKMETESPASAAKKETSSPTTSKPTTTTNSKAPEPTKTSGAELGPVSNGPAHFRDYLGSLAFS